MGNKNSRPNFVPLLSLLSYLVRSGNIKSDDIDVSDSDSDSESGASDQSQGIDFPKHTIYNDFMTNNSKVVYATQQKSYDLSSRDSFFASSRDFTKSMLNEMEAGYGIKKDNKLASTVCKTVSHFCFGDFEKTLMICALAKGIIKDRKAHESSIAVKVLSALLHIRDKFVHQRIDLVVNTIIEGIAANVEYEQELLLLLDMIHNELLTRSIGEKGLYDEVLFHREMIDHIGKIIALFGKNISHHVKHKILKLVKSLMYIKGEPVSLSNSTNASSKTITLAYCGCNLDQSDGHQWQMDSSSQMQERRALKCELVHFIEEETVKDKVFDSIKNLYMNVADAIILQCTQTSNTYFVPNGPQNMLDHSKLVDTSAFYEYFSVLRECLTGRNAQKRLRLDKQWTQDITEFVLQAFWKIDDGGRNQHRSPADILKGEMIIFFETLATLDYDKFVQALLNDTYQVSQDAESNSSSDPIIKMMEIYVTSKSNHDYNETYMMHFYSLLAILAEKNVRILKTMLDHDNWKWALRSFVLNQNIAKPGHLYDVLLRNTIKYVSHNEKFRLSIFKSLIASDGNDSFLDSDSPDAVLILLDTIFDAEMCLSNKRKNNLHCISTFVSGEYGGMSKISVLTKTFFTQLADSGDVTENETGLKRLYYCVNCMLIIIRTLCNNDAIFEVFGEIWPEIDEVNSILTQIITKTEDEWNICCKDGEEGGKYVAKIVSIATDLQSLLVAASL